MTTKSTAFPVKPVAILASALFLAGMVAALPAHAATTGSSSSTSTHRPIKHARNATRHQKKMISKTDPSAVRTNSTAKTQ